MGLVLSLIAFIRGSPKRLWFYQFEAVEGNHRLASLRAFCPTLWIMRLILLQAINCHYTPIILWLQEVDEQVRTNSRVKAGGFLQTMRKFSTYFYVELLRMVLPLLKAATQLQNAQLNFCKAQDVVACTKASITRARNDARFDSVWSGILSATEANDVINDPELSRPRKVLRRLDESSNAFFHAEPKIIIDSYITKCWIP